jgi:hypothetical protein
VLSFHHQTANQVKSKHFLFNNATQIPTGITPHCPQEHHKTQLESLLLVQKALSHQSDPLVEMSTAREFLLTFQSIQHQLKSGFETGICPHWTSSCPNHERLFFPTSKVEHLNPALPSGGNILCHMGQPSKKPCSCYPKG